MCLRLNADGESQGDGAEVAGKHEHEGGEKQLERQVEGALAQCLHVLYGIDLPHRNPDWGDMEVCIPLQCSVHCGWLWTHCDYQLVCLSNLICT